MTLPVDSFGRKFRDMPGDNWSVDLGQPLTILPDGTVVPPSGSYPDENHGGLFVPTGPHWGFQNVAPTTVNVAANNIHVVRFVPKRAYTIKAMAVPNAVPAPAAPHNAELGIYKWDGATGLNKIAGIARLNKWANVGVGGTDVTVWAFAADVSLEAGGIYYSAIWSDKLVVIACGTGPTVMENKYFVDVATLAGGGTGSPPDIEAATPNALFAGLPATLGGAPWILNNQAFISIQREKAGSYPA